MKTKIFAGACAVIVAAFLLGAREYKKNREQRLGSLAKESASLFVRKHSPVLGPKEAKVQIVKFTDPACETCAAFSGFVHQGLEAHPGKLNLVIRYAPFHEGADQAVKILEAARKQGKYWETLDLLYATQSFWTHHHRVEIDRIWKFLPQLGLDVERVRKDMNDPAIAELIERDLADAKALKVEKTPGFFVNGKPLEPFGYRELQVLIEGEIASVYPG